jgi:hypothetical protein
MKLKTALLIGSAIVIVETLLFVLFVFGGKPQPSVAIGLIVYAPFLFVLNLILGLLFYFRKSKQVAAVIFINSVISPVIFYFIWTAWYDGYSDRYYSRYSFSVRSDKFEIVLAKNSNDFSIADVTNQSNGTATEVYYGKYQIKGDTIVLASFKYNMFIVNNKLYDFPRDSSARSFLQKTG